MKMKIAILTVLALSLTAVAKLALSKDTTAAVHQAVPSESSPEDSTQAFDLPPVIDPEPWEEPEEALPAAPAADPEDTAVTFATPDSLPPQVPGLESDFENKPQSTERLPAIIIEDAPLPEVLAFLAEQAELDIEIDPELFDIFDSEGISVPPPHVSLSLFNATPRQALEVLLKENGLVMVQTPGTRSGFITRIPLDLAHESSSPESPAVPAAPAVDPEMLPVLHIGEMPLLDVITLLADASRIDIIFDPNLLPGGAHEMPLTDLPAMKFANKSPRQALDAILNNHDLVLVYDERSQISRVTRRPPPELEPLLTEIIQLRYSNITNMAELIQGTISPRSRVLPDPRTSQLVVRATARELEGITNLVAQLDSPTKQVLIEAQLLETSRSPRSIKGIDWSGTLEAQHFTFGNGITTGFSESRSPGTPTVSTLPSGREITSTPGTSQRSELTTILGAGGLSANTARGLHPSTAFLNADGVRAVLSFLNTEADTKVLATPRAVTVDNGTATLEVTRAFPIFEITPGAANVPAGAKISYTNLGTILNVTPRITADSNVFLRVIPEVSNIDSVDRQTINGQENTANVYAIRKIETHVTVPSGSTLVMGGLISDSTSKAFTKVPILGDIPGLGLLFRRDSKARTQANLLVFITPTIVGDHDFQPAFTDFLQTRAPGDSLEPPVSSWDRGRPHYPPAPPGE